MYVLNEIAKFIDICGYSWPENCNYNSTVLDDFGKPIDGYTWVVRIQKKVK